jgi:hypothetical protein
METMKAFVMYFAPNFMHLDEICRFRLDGSCSRARIIEIAPFALCLIGMTLKAGQGGLLDLAQRAAPHRLADHFACSGLTCVIPALPRWT